MTSMNSKSMTMAELERLLEVYGAERARWPAEVRASAALLVAADPAARRLLAETEALDRVLDRAPVPGLPVEVALVARIVAAAQRSPRIVPLPGAQPVGKEAGPGKAAPRLAAPVGRGRWQPRLPSRQMGAAGVLAASLVMGVLIGNAGLPPQVLPALAEMAGFAADRDDLVRIALSEEVTE
jgi:hypothetical protein